MIRARQKGSDCKRWFTNILLLSPSAPAPLQRKNPAHATGYISSNMNANLKAGYRLIGKPNTRYGIRPAEYRISEGSLGTWNPRSPSLM